MTRVRTKNFWVLLGIVLSTAAGTHGVRPNEPARRTVSPTDSQEINLGAALAARFDVDRGIQPMPETQRIEAYLQRITDSLGKHAHRQLPWRIHFDPHPSIKSGFALPGGHIVIWGGILAYMSTEDEAAAVIAHEIEHIDDGQVTRRIDSLVRTQHRDVNDPKQWTWGEFVALGKVHAPSAPAPKAIVDRIHQIDREIADEHWESRTKTRPLQLRGNG